MKFAHMADCHIGSWRDPKMSQLNIDAFIKATDNCIEEKVDFVLIAGDLFNTSLPAIDRLKTSVVQLRKLKDNNIPVYCVPGSHDFSPSGKTMLDVLEEAGMLVNVVKGSVKDDKLYLRFTLDKTGAKLTGMLGRRGTLEKKYYESLEKKSLESEDGFKIFILHSALEEFKPKDMAKIESAPLSLLPKGFDYYAGGHVHYVFQKNEPGYGIIAYPGPLFPNSFSELEKLGCGGFYIFDNGKLEHRKVRIKNIQSLDIDCSMKTPDEIERDIVKKIDNQEFVDTVVTLRLRGTIASGRVSDINFRDIISSIYNKGAYFVMKSTTQLNSDEYEEIKIDQHSVEDVETALIDQHVGQSGREAKEEKELTRSLLTAFDDEKSEGERVLDFEDRLREKIDRILGF